MDADNFELPFEIKDLDPELNSELIRLCPGYLDGLVRAGPKGYLLPYGYKRLAHQYYKMPLRDSDVFVMGYPRSGTNWTQELVWLIVNNLDYETAKSVSLSKRSLMIDWSYLCHPVTKANLRKNNSNNVKAMEFLDMIYSEPKTFGKIPSPRILKTHLPFSLLPPTLLDSTRVVYVARDPRDVIISHFHLTRTSVHSGFNGDFDQYFEHFINDQVYLSPSFENIKEAWAVRDHSNMLFLFYEDMLRDLPSVVRRVAQFFGKQYTEEQVTQLCEHLSFDNLKKNPQFNAEFWLEIGLSKPGDHKVIRKGKAGGWREVFDAGMRAQADEWIARHLRDTDLRFPSMDTDQLH